jgi:hypothetical protein
MTTEFRCPEGWEEAPIVLTRCAPQYEDARYEYRVCRRQKPAPMPVDLEGMAIRVDYLEEDRSQGQSSCGPWVVIKMMDWGNVVNVCNVLGFRRNFKRSQITEVFQHGKLIWERP